VRKRDEAVVPAYVTTLRAYGATSDLCYDAAANHLIRRWIRKNKDKNKDSRGADATRRSYNSSSLAGSGGASIPRYAASRLIYDPHHRRDWTAGMYVCWWILVVVVAARIRERRLLERIEQT
jgi:hypothetical protein